MADFYGTAAGFDAYLTARGRAIPAGTDPEKEAALLVASEWIDAVYGGSFSGSKTGVAGVRRDQIRAWPRTGAWENIDYSTFPNDAIPREVEYATYEAAQRQMTTPGSLSLDYTPGKYKSVAVSGAISVTYAQFSAAADVQTQFTLIDQILAPLLTGNGDGSFSSLSGSLARV